jgi:hypothetical protein
MTKVSRLVLLLLALALSATCRADEPRAAFTAKNGWVDLALQQDGKPVADAVVQIIDEKGTPFGEGETGATGQASFPMPRGASFLVEIKADGRTSDPIRLHVSDARIEPARVLLSYGLRPCCRFKTTNEEPPPVIPPTAPAESSLTNRIVWGVGLAGVTLAAAAYFVQKRRSSSPLPKE